MIRRTLSALCVVCGCLALSGLGVFAAEPPEIRSPQTPAQELASFVFAPGFKAELVAAEPEIEAPVAMAFGADGRLWVVEMRDYPNGPEEGEPPRGRIKLLTDTDQDGRFETAKIFADKISFGNGLLPWKDGVIVTAAPQILWLRDTDGDDVCDTREVLFEGFSAGNPQLRVSHPILGLDGFVYVANGLRGGEVVRPAKAGEPPAEPVKLAGMDFRFNMLDGRYEAISGMGQYGNTFDDWGHRFVCDNRHHLRQVVLESRYIKRNPFLAVADVVQDISAVEETFAGAGAKIYPLSRNWTTSNLHAGRFTAACGVFIYRGNGLPKDYYGAAFTCDPTANILHAEHLEQRGGSYLSKPMQEGREFLATRDEWFRPVSLTHGPDGALYLVDMYRAVIEHPEWMPVELQKRKDLLLGRELGRIWRIVPVESAPDAAKAVAAPALQKLNAPELVAQLRSPNVWQRETAQRLLLERGVAQAVDPLRAALTAPSPQTRVLAAWLLGGGASGNASAFLSPDLEKLLSDEHPRVREQAILLWEKRTTIQEAGKPVENADLLPRVMQMSDDPDSLVRMQVALSLGFCGHSPNAPLQRIGVASNDLWTRTAILCSLTPETAGQMLASLGGTAPVTSLSPEFARELAILAVARKNPAEVAPVFSALPAVGADLRLTLLGAVAEGLRRRGTTLTAFLRGFPDSQKVAADQATAVLADAAVQAGAASAPGTARLTAIQLLSEAPWDIGGPVLLRLFTEDPAPEIRAAAVRALGAQSDPAIGATLLASWKASLPGLRREILDALFRNGERISLVLEAIEKGDLKPGDIDPIRTKQLMSSPNVTIRDRAKKLLQASVAAADRQPVIEKYKAALEMAGDPKRGQALFAKTCAACHRIGETGNDVGPSIADTRTKTPAALLTDILNPNQAIDNNFVQYVIETKAGRTISGVIAVETASSVTLKQAESKTETVLRQDIEDLTSTGQSMMPTGFENNLSLADMADLLNFLKNWRYLDGLTPLAGEK